MLFTFKSLCHPMQSHYQSHSILTQNSGCANHHAGRHSSPFHIAEAKSIKSHSFAVELIAVHALITHYLCQCISSSP